MQGGYISVHLVRSETSPNKSPWGPGRAWRDSISPVWPEDRQISSTASQRTLWKAWRPLLGVHQDPWAGDRWGLRIDFKKKRSQIRRGCGGFSGFRAAPWGSPDWWGEALEPLAAAMRAFPGHLVEELCRPLTMTPQVLDGRLFLCWPPCSPFPREGISLQACS